MPPAKMHSALRALCRGDEEDTCVCGPQYRVALSALGGGDGADTCVCLSQERAAPPAHDGGDERSGGNTYVCFPQTRTALFAHGGGDKADTSVCCLQCSQAPHMVAEPMQAQACVQPADAHCALSTRWWRRGGHVRVQPASLAAMRRRVGCSDEKKGWEEARHYFRLITGAHSAGL